MPKRSIFIPPPFHLGKRAGAEWRDLQVEAGGFRGKGLSNHEIWQLGLAAEFQAEWRRGKSNEYDLKDLARYRAIAGLPPLPALRRAA